MASEDLSLLDQVASELLLLPPSPLLCPGARVVYQPLYDTCTHAHTYTCMCAHIAGQYISLSVTGSVCVSPIIWPLDSNGQERRVGFPCGLNTTAFITHNRSTILALPLTGQTERRRRRSGAEGGTGSNKRSVVDRQCVRSSRELCVLSCLGVYLHLAAEFVVRLHNF